MWRELKMNSGNKLNKRGLFGKTFNRGAVFEAALFVFGAVFFGGDISLYAQVKSAPNFDYQAQKAATETFAVPIESYNGFAGTYGELRGNHFHCGLDMRTSGVTGKKIYAAEDGYVSRITTVPSGFGNMITITHPSGYKTIYGHLLRFASKYQEYVRAKQYAEESWYQEIDFAPDEFPVKRGELIAYSGNSGSSGGPHLHFEVRDADGVPINLQLTGCFDIKDVHDPVIRDVRFLGAMPWAGVYYTFPVKSAKAGAASTGKTASNGKAAARTAANSVIHLPASSYVAIDAYDLIDANSGKLAIYIYEAFLDDTCFFRFTEGNIPYATGRYIASLLDNPLRQSTKRYYVKSLLEPGNKLSDRIECVNGGRIVLEDTLEHTVTVKVTDVCGNSAQKSFKVRRDDALYNGVLPFSPAGDFMRWNQDNLFYREGLRVKIPQGALYSSFYMNATTAKVSDSPYSAYWIIGDTKVPLHKDVEITMRASVPEKLADKAVLARVRDNGGLSSCGGVYDASTKTISATISAFGSFKVAVDTVAPVATFKFAEGAKITSNSVSVRIGDKLSGIKKYRVEIDGHWVVAEHDGKTATLIVPLKDARIRKGTRHDMVVELTDNVGNHKIYKRKFFW